MLRDKIETGKKGVKEKEKVNDKEKEKGRQRNKVLLKVKGSGEGRQGETRIFISFAKTREEKT